jgi:hypothetical protein
VKKASLEDRLRNYLRAFPADQVERFIHGLKAILLRNAAAPRTANAAAKRRGDIKRISAAATAFKTMSLNTFGADFMRPLIGNAVVSIVDTGGLEQFREDLQSGYSGELSPLFTAWVEMMPYLNSFIVELDAEIVRKRPKSRGRGRADPGQMLMAIGAIYARIFGEMPTSTEGGAFYNIAVEILGQKNVQRPVQAAVASLRSV